LEEGQTPQIRLVCTRETQTEIDISERAVIERLKQKKGTKLCNLTSGGDGSYTMNDEVRKKMSESHMGEKNHFYGKTHPEETRAKIAMALKGRSLPLHHRQNISKSITGKKNPFYGRKHSQETKDKIAAKHAKTYILRNPAGVVVTITNLNRFCKENGLNQAAMWNLAKRPDRRKKYRGWTHVESTTPI